MDIHFNFSPIRLKTAEASVYRIPIDEPVQTSFGVMHDRPAVVVRLEDSEGLTAWGEVWCNFPSVGAEKTPLSRIKLFVPQIGRATDKGIGVINRCSGTKQ